MSISKRTRDKLKARDPYCWHCGQDWDLVIHHRKNRQMGGSSLLDHYTNLMMVCEQYNFQMEANAVAAQEAKEWGHKLESWEKFTEPVFDRCNGIWYELRDDGTKVESNYGRDERIF